MANKPITDINQGYIGTKKIIGINIAKNIIVRFGSPRESSQILKPNLIVLNKVIIPPIRYAPHQIHLYQASENYPTSDQLLEMV